MLHLKSFFNFLSRNKLYTAINIFGFAAFVIALGTISGKAYHLNSSATSASILVAELFKIKI